MNLKCYQYKKRVEEYRRQLQLVFEAKYLVNMIDELQNTLNFILDLQQKQTLINVGNNTGKDIQLIQATIHLQSEKGRHS